MLNEGSGCEDRWLGIQQKIDDETDEHTRQHIRKRPRSKTIFAPGQYHKGTVDTEGK